MLALIAFLLMQMSNVPTTGNVLATPQPAATTDPLFVFHATKADLAEGRHLFEVKCSSCHGAHLQGSAQGPPLAGLDIQAFDFMLRTGRMPSQVSFEQEMHQQARFPPDKERDIIDYVLSTSGGNKVLPHVTLHFDKGSLATGRHVWEENCEMCHAATGEGNSVDYRDVAPSVMDASPQVVADAVRFGPDVMPRFGPDVIDQARLDDLASYVWFLQHGKYNPGGLRLSNWGPVDEGFMLWAVAMPLLVLLVRRIGSTE